MSGGRCAWLALMLGWLPVIGSFPLRAQPPVIDQEYEIKAAYLRFFGLYTQWPGAMGDAKEFTIGVLGKDPFGGVLDRLAKEKTVDGKKIVIQRFKQLVDLKPCHVLFVSKEEPLAAVVKMTQGSSVLVVGDAEGLAGRGAVADFFISDNKVKVAIDLEAAKSAGLKISSDLLRVAKIVKPKGSE